MKYVLAGFAAVAAVAALIFRPPQGDRAASAPADSSTFTPVSGRPHSDVVRTAGPHLILVYVAGEVIKPGVYALPAQGRAQDALARAGGPKPDADLVAVNLAAPVTDGEEIAVPKVGAETPRSRRSGGPRSGGTHVRAAHSSRGHGHRRRATPEPLTPAQAVDLNSADASELETVPGIGPALAARIVAYRAANGPFKSLDELADVSGITSTLQERVADFVVIR